MCYYHVMQVYDRRTRYVKGPNERNLWKQITAAYMSDEETDDEGNGFLVKKLQWRSNLLNRLVARLDKRYHESRNSTTVRKKPRESRKPGGHSLRKRPYGAPKWTYEENLCTPAVTPASEVEDLVTDEPSSVLVSEPSPMATEPSMATSSTSANFPVSDHISTPSGIPGRAAEPTHLFENYDAVDDDDTDNDDDIDDDSDEELTTMIRAATMKLY